MVERLPVSTTRRRPASPAAIGSLAADLDTAVRQAQQRVIDAEVRATRRAYLGDWRDRLRTDPRTLADARFLAGADRAIVHAAVIVAARGAAGADACDLQLTDPDTGALHMTRHVGLSPAFLDYFAAVDATVPSACGTALATGDPVLIDDVAGSPVFAGQPTLAVMRAAGSRAVQSYPLWNDRGGILGMLSLHYRTAGPRERQDGLARVAGHALADITGGGGDVAGCAYRRTSVLSK